MAALAPPAVADAPCSPTPPRALPQPRHVPRLPTPHFAPRALTRSPLVYAADGGRQAACGCGGQWGVSAGEQVGRLVGWGGSGCRGIARGPQAPVELCCCLCLRLAASATLLVCCVCCTTHSCASKYGMVHTLFGMPSRACVSISNKAQQCQIKLE